MYPKYRFTFVLAASVLALGTAVFTMAAQEEKVDRSQVPEAVLKAVEARYPGAALVGFEQETEDKELLYEVALDSTDAHLEVVVSPEGRILVEEQSIDLDDLPGPVQRGLASSRYASAKVIGVERVNTIGKGPTFEIVVDDAGVEHELVFSESGDLQKDEKHTRD